MISRRYAATSLNTDIRAVYSRDGRMPWTKHRFSTPPFSSRHFPDGQRNSRGLRPSRRSFPGKQMSTFPPSSIGMCGHMTRPHPKALLPRPPVRPVSPPLKNRDWAAGAYSSSGVMNRIAVVRQPGQASRIRTACPQNRG